MKTACCIVRLLLLCITRSAFRKSFVRIPLTGRICGCILLLFSLPEHATAQDPVFSDFKKVPVPPSPNVAALGKFGEIPVSHSTGIPSIQIPIYSYSDNQKDLRLNVALSYHAGGHKVEDMASNVGLGWALQAGGVISRTVKGLPDDLPSYGYINTPPLPYFNTTYDENAEADQVLTPSPTVGVTQTNSPYFTLIKSIANSQYDGEADIFNISVGDINAKFFFDKNDSVVLVEYSNVYVKTIRGTGGVINSFIVYDSKGVTYHFDITESTQSDNAVEPSVPAPPAYVSSWYLSKIVSADKKDEITLAYASTVSSLYYETGITVSYKTTDGLNPQITSSQNLSITYEPKRISRITFPDQATVDFFYNYEREDYDGDMGMDSIRITNNQFGKSYKLSYGYFVSDNCTDWCAPGYSVNNWQKRLKLLSVQEINGQTATPPHVFEYNSTPLPFRSSKEQDWWGFYNGGATGGIVDSLAPPFAIFNREKPPSLTHCKAWVLEKITYPTGGYTNFVYELNEGLQDTTVRAIGGLRVKEREDHEPVSNTTYTTTYRYTMKDNTTSGLLLSVPSYTAYWNRMGVFTSNNIRGGTVVYYNETLNPSQTLSYFSGSPVIYKRVKEEQYVNGSSNGYKVYEFETSVGGLMHDFFYPFIQRQDEGWVRGQPKRTEVYNNLGVLLSREENEYQSAGVLPNILDTLTRNLVVGNYYWDNFGADHRYLYGARSYYLSRGWKYLTKTTSTEYAGGDSLKTITEYTYNNTHYVPTKVKTTSNKGEEIEVRTYYPFNYNIAPYNTMKSKYNRVAEPISVETWITKGGTSKARSIIVNEYGTVNTSLLKKKKIYVLESDKPVSLSAFNQDSLVRSPSRIKENMVIEQFDTRGRGVQFKFVGGEKKSVIWGDHNEFPIASVDNAAFSEVAYTSFECSEKGNWTYGASAITNTSAPTGTKVYAVSNGLSKTLNPQKEYVLTLWENGSVTITNATLLRTGKTIDGWVYKEYTIPASASGISFSGSGYVDEVRLFPKGALMNSYTYHHGTNLQNQSDANGTITRYEYDALGRLKLIRNEDKEIVKQMMYHYKLNNQ